MHIKPSRQYATTDRLCNTRSSAKRSRMLLLLGGRFSSLHRRASGTESGGGWGRGTLQADKQTELLAIMMSVCDCRMGSEVAIEEIGDAELCH